MWIEFTATTRRDMEMERAAGMSLPTDIHVTPNRKRDIRGIGSVLIERESLSFVWDSTTTVLQII